MILNLKYFGMIAEAINKNEESFTFLGKSILELDLAIKAKYVKLEQLNYTFAVNQAMANKDLLLTENDEVALLPPFAGG